MRSALLVTLLCTGFVCNVYADTLPDNKDTAQLARSVHFHALLSIMCCSTGIPPLVILPDQSPTCRHYFWNEVTGETQYEDPGGENGLLLVLFGVVTELSAGLTHN